MENVTEKISDLLGNKEFTDQFKSAQSQEDIKKLFANNGLVLSSEDINGFMQEMQKRVTSLSESELDGISGGKCAIGTIAEGVGDIAKGVGRGIGYGVGGVAKGTASFAYNTGKGVGKIAWGTVKIPANVVIEAGKGFWKGLTE